MDVDYTKQIQQKQEYLRTLFHQEVPVLKQTNPYSFRNRMDFVITADKLGLKQSYKEVVDISRCEVLKEPLNKILTTIREWFSTEELTGCTPGSFDGFLRFVMLRGDDQEQQVTLTTTTHEHQEAILRLADNLAVKSFVWLVEEESTERSVGSKEVLVVGEREITLRLANKQFLISSHTFFQTSPEMAEKAIEYMKRYVHGRVLDLYCGVGVLGQALSSEVVGVDSNKENVLQARRNAEINSVQAEYFVEDAARFLRKEAFDTIIVDPPRTGLQTGVHSLLASNAETIVYLSCNPKTQARDLVFLKQVYEVIDLQAFDFFAHTEHVECLAVLRKK